MLSPLSRPLQPSLLTLCLLAAWQTTFAQTTPVTELSTVTVSAETELKQALGASIIDAEDLSKMPPANDLSEIIRKQPGINLTGNSTSGQRGNNRQIDIRGMGPENTLILIDGKPVSSRNAVRYGWRGERDTRGDTNWVPAESVERIEVLRGPAAARYGNGAAGGVVNIITKPVAEQLSGSTTVYYKKPQHSDEGGSKRIGFNLSGPISEQLGFRLYGNLNKTDSDAFDINKNHASSPRIGTNAGSYAAGREGVRNKDINGLLSWQLNASHRFDLEAAYSRQGNIYTGDTQNTNHDRGTEQRPGKNLVASHLGSETNRMYRQNYALTHRGDWTDDASTLSYIQYENTRNTRLSEGLAGGTEGLFDTGTPANIDLKTFTAHTELTTELNAFQTPQVLTIGAEWVNQRLQDQASNLKVTNNIQPPSAYQSKNQANIYSIFAENNMYVTDSTTLIPGLRFDYHSKHGSSFSPSLNLSQQIHDNWTVKAGIARAYKAPNLYQNNDGYTLYSRGLGCAGGGSGGGCFLMGNSDLKAEHSINKELGLEYAADSGLLASLTYFRNDYKNKVEAGSTALYQHQSQIGANTVTADVYQWHNVPKAVVQGLEGNLSIPFYDDQVWWRTNFTYMIESKNKQTNDYLSVIPKYTINSSLDWQITPKWSVLGQLTWYGKQTPQKYDYQGKPVTGSAADTLSPYALVGLSTKYMINKRFSVSAGVDNLFDKRLFRRGNASGVNTNPGNPNMLAGAGAHTYNEPGRSFFIQAQARF